MQVEPSCLPAGGWVHLRRRGTRAPHQVLSRQNDKKLYAPCGMRRGVERHGGLGGGARYITGPVTASSWLSAGSLGAEGPYPRFVLLPSSVSALERWERESEREEEGRRVPGPPEDLLPVKMHLLILSLETCVLIPSQKAWKETTLHLVRWPTYSFQTDWS